MWESWYDPSSLFIDLSCSFLIGLCIASLIHLSPLLPSLIRQTVQTKAPVEAETSTLINKRLFYCMNFTLNYTYVSFEWGWELEVWPSDQADPPLTSISYTQ